MRRPLVLSASLTILARLSAAAQVPVAAPPDTPRFVLPPLAAGLAVDAELLRRLPVDEARDALFLFPGVSARFAGAVAVRGGAFGDEAVFVDGVRVRSFTFGTTHLRLGIDALADAGLETGPFAVAHGPARSGVLSYRTRSGGETWAGSVRASSDGPLPGPVSAGFHQLEASGGGPLGRALRFFGAALVQGNRSVPVSSELRRLPVYIADGIDTTVAIASPSGGPSGAADVQQVPIPRFVESRSGAGIPFSQRDLYALSGRLDAPYGRGSRLFLTALAAREQGLGLFGGACPGNAVCALYNPVSRSGTRAKGSALILGWTHPLGVGGARPAELDVRLALVRDRVTAGPIAPGLDLAPAMGFRLDDLDLLVDEREFPVDDRLVENILRNQGRRTPLDPRGPGLRPRQEFRMNPYAVASGFPIRGVGGPFVHARERQLQARAALEWRPHPRHRVALGFEHVRVDAAYASVPDVAADFIQAWVERPAYSALYLQETLAAGDLAITIGARLDRLDPRTRFARVPGYLDPDDPATSAPARAQAELSPRLAVSFQPDDRSALRGGFGWFAQVPELDDYFAGKNTDGFRFQNTPGRPVFARPIHLLTARALELGYRRRLPGGWSVDLAVHQREDLRDIDVHGSRYEDPLNPGGTVFLDVVTDSGAVTVRGADLWVATPAGRFGFARLGYGFQDIGPRPPHGRLDLDLDPAHLPPWGALRQRLWEEPVHAVSGAFLLQVPERAGAPRALGGLWLSGVLRLASPRRGLGPGLEAGWLKSLDLRLGRAVRVAGLEGEFWLDARNPLDWGLPVRDARLARQVEDQVEGHQLTLGVGHVRDVDLSSLAAADVRNEVDLVLLRRAEARFGNGDGIFTAAEQDRAFRAAVVLQAVAGADQLAGRRIRVGAGLRF